MLGRKKYPVLTTSFCDKIERLRLAIEVVIATKACITSLDLNSGKGTVRLGVSQNETVFVRDHFEPTPQGCYYFALNEPDNWFVAMFKLGYVMVRCVGAPEIRVGGKHIVWNAGFSADDCWIEPVNLKQALAEASAAGLSLEDYLKT